MSVAVRQQHDGVTDPGYEHVREVFARGICKFSVGGASFAAYVRGRLVVDVWGGWLLRDGPGVATRWPS